MIKKSITVTNSQEQWIQAQIATGAYASYSEVIREALREKQAHNLEIEQIRAALIVGEESGISNKTVAEIWEESKRKYVMKNEKL